jgi:predicted porin
MKKAGLAAALMSAGVMAHAQTSVTLYGRIDAGIEYISGLPNDSYTGSTSRWRAQSGDWGTSLWGLKGAEDLGGGTKAVFQLEGSFDAMSGGSGSAGSIWNRWATVGLANPEYGTFLLGRELFISNGVWDFDPFGQSNWSSASLVRGRNWPQSSNNVSYQSPSFAGFDVYGQFALSNATNWNGNGTTPQGREGGLQITYTSPVFQVRGIYDEIRNSADGNLNGADGAFSFSREYTAAVNVFLGPFKVQGAYQAIRASRYAAGAAAPTSLDHEWGGITWQATPRAAVIAAVYHVNANNGFGNATIYTLGGSYNLSKRTLLDFQIAQVRDSKTANFGLDANAFGPGGTISGSSYNENPLPGHLQTGFYAGIQHVF